jgi:hypothetical protein
MWLSGEQYPDFRTINHFRSDRMKEVIYGSVQITSDLPLVMKENGNQKMGMNQYEANICARTAMNAPFNLLVQKGRT